jgi:signal recognition particle subunit SEC65
MTAPKISNLPFFPIIISIVPALMMLGNNIGEVQPDEALRVILISLAGVSLLIITLILLFRDRPKAALICLVLEILFFCYGHIYEAVKGTLLFGFVIGRHVLLASLWVLIFLFLAWLILRSRKLDASFTRFLNLISVLLLIWPTFQIANHYLQTSLAEKAASQDQQSSTATEIAFEKPDIYYIILDTYTRDDVLLHDFNYDNQGFLDDLESRGFTIARSSCSNYSTTMFSLASSLNMAYMDQISEGPIQDVPELVEVVQHSRVRSTLEALGYHIVALASYPRLWWEDADFYLSTDWRDIPDDRSSGSMTAFELMFLKSTALNPILKIPFFQSLVFTSLDFPYSDRLKQQRYILNSLPDLPAYPTPKFVFVHLLTTHPPILFNQDGQVLSDPIDNPWVTASLEDSPELHIQYRDSIIYTNRVILDFVDQVIERSATPPIIILQGDHGYVYTGRDENKILNAMLVPAGYRNQVPDDLSPVNTFRLLFSILDGEPPEFLPNLFFLSNRENLLDFDPIPDSACTRYE